MAIRGDSGGAERTVREGVDDDRGGSVDLANGEGWGGALPMKSEGEDSG